MAGGRPTKYTDELLAMAYEYIEGFEARGKQQREDKDDSWEIVPSAVGLARFIGIDSTTLYAWCKEEGKEEFSLIAKLVQDEQHLKLINSGLKGYIEKSITKLMLSKHGYAEKQQIDNTSSDGTMSPKGFNDFYSQDDE